MHPAVNSVDRVTVQLTYCFRIKYIGNGVILIKYALTEFIIKGVILFDQLLSDIPIICTDAQGGFIMFFCGQGQKNRPPIQTVCDTMYFYSSFFFFAAITLTAARAAAPTSVSIAVRLMMIEGDTVVIAHHIEIMLHIWKNTPADLDCTQVLRSRFPSDTVAPQAGTQEAHIKDSVMGNKDTFAHDRLYLLPKLCKVRNAFDFLSIYARELRLK